MQGKPLGRAAGPGHIGQNISSVVQIDIADISIGSGRIAINRPQSYIPAETQVQSKPGVDLEFILEIRSVDPAAVLGFKHVSSVRAIRKTEQERSECIARTGGAGRVLRRRRRKRFRRIEDRRVGVVGGEGGAHLKCVPANDLCEATAKRPVVGIAEGVLDGLLCASRGTRSRPFQE